MKNIEVLFTPAEFALLPQRDLSRAVCVVFDILRATSTIVTALAHGAKAIVPVAEISEAIAWRGRQPEVLLAGERGGLRISAAQAGGVEFDLSNSPREYTRMAVSGKTIVTTTTNGTRALRACAGARGVLVGSFLNLMASVHELVKLSPDEVVVVCSGTHEELAFEDVLAAGAFCGLVAAVDGRVTEADSAQLAREVYLRHEQDLLGAMQLSTNGLRLLSIPQLSEDVPYCLQREIYDFAAPLGADGLVRLADSRLGY